MGRFIRLPHFKETMKAILSHRIYLEVDGQTGKSLRDKLTYTIPVYGDGPPMVINNFTIFRPGLMTLPAGRADLIPKGYEVVDKRILVPVEYPKPLITLRESQQEIYDLVDDNCLINAKVGWGKTFMALALAAKLGQKALVVVHTLPLMHQWAKDVETVFGFKPGLIGGGKEDWSAPITIGNVASLYKRMDKLQKTFGTLIMDEVHHAPSPTFTKVVDKCYARFKIGLSGTLERKDGMHVLLPDYFGYKVYKPLKENTLNPIIHAYDTGILFPYGDIWANRVNALYISPSYINWCLKMIERYKKEGHKILFVSDRVDFLKFISEKSGLSLIIGDTQDRDKEFKKIDEGETHGLCGTLAIFKEGISYNPFSCLILGAPINNMPMLEQVVGRVQRLSPGKTSCIVVDPVLRGNTTEKQFLNRTGFYMKEGFEIKYL